MSNNKNKKKKLEIVSGDNSDLEISSVHNHINSLKPKDKNEKKPKNIVVPKQKKKKNN